MGTSTNHESPPTPNWNVARALLGRTDVAPDRQSQELWRAIFADRGDRLVDALGSSVLAEAAGVAAAQPAPAEAVRAYDAAVRESQSADLTIDMGRRALVRATAEGAGGAGFAAELFAEAAAYYVARDLPSVVGKDQRVSNPAEAIRLKDAIRSVARTTARAAVGVAGLTTGAAAPQPTQWRAYVSSVVGALRGAPPAGPAAPARAPRRPRRGNPG